MKKAIVIIRTSTVRQEIEAQKKEILEYAKSFGYTEDEILVVGEKGASAIKLNELYLKNLKLIYSIIETTSSIEKVFAWSLDRIARVDNVLLEFKNFLVEHRVNLIIKNPSLILFNPDGTVNNGVELAMSLFATMAQQEMQIKQDRFMRAKRAYAAEGKFIGARYMMFGYSTDPNGYLIINEEEAKIVRFIFNYYITGKTSTKKLAVELNERGERFRGRRFGEGHIINILKNEAYTGHLSRNSLVQKYPPIIDLNTYNKAKEIRSSRNSNLDKSTKHISLALKILKCWECGGNYMYLIAGRKDKKDIKYVCYNRAKKYRLNPKDVCTGSCAVQVKVMDRILTDLSMTLKGLNSLNLDKTRRRNLTEKRKVLLIKIDNITLDLENINRKYSKIVDAWTNEYLTDEMYKVRIDRLKSEEVNLEKTLKTYEEEIRDIDRVLGSKVCVSDINKPEDYEDPVKLKSIINQYIKVAYPKAIKVGGTNLTIIMVADFNDEIYNYVFHQKHGLREGLYKFRNGKIVPYRLIVKGDDPRTSTAIKNIQSDENLMDDLRNQIRELNEEMKKKLG